MEELKDYLALCAAAEQLADRLRNESISNGNQRDAELAGQALVVIKNETAKVKDGNYQAVKQGGYGPGRFVSDYDWPDTVTGTAFVQSVYDMQNYWQKHMRA